MELSQRWRSVVATLKEHAREYALNRRYGRRVSAPNGRAHVQVRSPEGPGFEPFRSRLRSSLGEVPGVHWADLLRFSGRVVVEYDKHLCKIEQLLEIIGEEEELAGLDDQPFPDRPEFPGDVQPLARGVIELTAEAAAFGSSLIWRASGLGPPPLQIDLAALISTFHFTPRLHDWLEGRFGSYTTEFLLSIGRALVNAAMPGQVGPSVAILERVLLFAEVVSRRETWRRREEDLHEEPLSQAPHPPRPPPRPVPLPLGPIEAYAKKTEVFSLAAFGLDLAVTRTLVDAAAPLFATLPRPAYIGRQAFAAQLGRMLAARDVVVVDSTVLRRLELVDCLVIEGDLLFRDRYWPTRVVPLEGDPEELEVQAATMFEPDRTSETQRQDGWSLGPLSAFADRLSERVQREVAAPLSARGWPVLVLMRGDSPVAIVATHPAPLPGAEELLAAARAAKMHVVVAAEEVNGFGHLPVDEIVPPGPSLTDTVRGLQSKGHVVALVLGAPHPALEAADCGVGLHRPGTPTPWGAHFLCRESLDDVRFLVAACAVAKRQAQESVQVAMVGGGVGLLLSLSGRGARSTHRVMQVMSLAATASIVNGLRHAWSVGRAPRRGRSDTLPWYALPADRVLSQLETTSAGLTAEEAQKRRRKISEKPPGPVGFGRAVVDELINPLTPVLVAGAGLSAAMGSLVDAAMISGVLGLNSVVGGWQRLRTERAVSALERRDRQLVRVRRGGNAVPTDIAELVPGDVIELESGEVVPADCRVLAAEALEIDESSLTGESLPVRKSAEPCVAASLADRRSMIYAETTVAAGRVVAVAVEVGEQTEARRAMREAAQTRPERGVEARLESLTRLTIPAALGSGAALAGLGLLRGQPFGDVIGTAVSLAMAAVPEGLPLLATVAQLSSAERLSERGALVRNPRAIEALGRVDVVCVDKTGTVTEGRIRLSSVSAGRKDQESRIGALSRSGREILAVALRASPAARESRALPHLTDQALVEGAELAEVTDAEGIGSWLRLSEIPFEAERGYHAGLGRSPQGLRLCVKGAPEVILERCSWWAHPENGVEALHEAARAALVAEIDRLAESGRRVLAVAERPIESETAQDEDVQRLILRGFVSFSDAVRPSAAAAVADLRRAGVDVVMVTGDHPGTASRIAMELDLLDSKGVLTGPELDELDDAALDGTLPEIRVFARVTPTHKVRIVRAYQRAGRAVAMTGDGLNDAPAIRAANAGIALGRGGASAARSAADLVVVDDRIETIVAAILEGRGMWASVRDAVSILVGGNLGEIGFMLAAGVLGNGSPLNARQLLLVNLLTDVAPAMAVALRPPPERTPEALLREGPEASLAGALTRDIFWRAGITGTCASGAWLLARWLLPLQRRASTVGLVSLVGAQLGQTIATGGRSPLVIATSLGSMAVLAAIVQTPVVSHFFGCRPLGPLGWGIAGGASVAGGVASLLWRKLSPAPAAVAPKPMVVPELRLVVNAAE
jgi:cation-transporting ATPase I